MNWLQATWPRTLRLGRLGCLNNPDPQSPRQEFCPLVLERAVAYQVGQVKPLGHALALGGLGCLINPYSPRQEFYRLGLGSAV